MDSTAIERRIRLGEDSQTEFKSVAEGLDAKVLAREIAAFANSRGGLILLGVEDEGTVTGVGSVKQADTLMLQVVQACQTRVHPAIWCSMTKVEIAGKLVLVIDVPASNPDRPYRADRGFYIRDATMTREAARDELVRMLQTQNIYYDEAPVGGASLADLNEEAVDSYLRTLYEQGAASRREHYLRSLKALDVGGAPTVAGILLFGNQPQHWLPDARISAVRFPGTAISTEQADHKEIGGTLLQQLELAMAFIPSPSSVSGLERVERRIPDIALREVLVNALSHRDYRAASQVRLFVFEDRVEVMSPGVLLNHLTLDSIRIAGISLRRNPIIASLLARARRSENLGIGIPEMIAQMRERGLPEPELSVEGGHFRVVLRSVAEARS